MNRAISILLVALILTVSVKANKQPNIVLIISDDQAWTDYSFMGHKTIETPNIDRLSKESLLFKRGYVPTSLCCPSLASIITGLYPHQTKITGNEPPVPVGGRAVNYILIRFRNAYLSLIIYQHCLDYLPNKVISATNQENGGKVTIQEEDLPME